MKCLTLKQPWATLVVLSVKRIETRSWGTFYRGPLAIHAAKRWTKADQRLCYEPPFYEFLGRNAPWELPLGAVLGIVFLHDCRFIWNSTDSRALNPNTLSEQERAFGDYANGRYAWVLTGAVAFPEPVPARGKLSLWQWDTSGIVLPEAVRS